jgi:hypothetical protein
MTTAAIESFDAGAEEPNKERWLRSQTKRGG